MENETPIEALEHIEHEAAEVLAENVETPVEVAPEVPVETGAPAEPLPADAPAQGCVCPNCDGSGKSVDDACSNCAGEGKV